MPTRTKHCRIPRRRTYGGTLANPIWDTLRDCNCFNLVVRQCFNQVEHKGQLKNRAKAIRVPPIRTGRVLPHAFTHTIDVRHVQVEAGIHTIGDAKHSSLSAGWGLPSELCTPHRHSPGCKYFGLWVFEECYSLAQIGDQSATVNQLAPQAQFRPRAFEKRSTLQQLNFERTECVRSHQPQSFHPQRLFFRGWDRVVIFAS